MPDRHPIAAIIVDEEGIAISSSNPLDVSGGSGGTSATDDAAFTPGASSLTPVGGIVTADSVDNGDVGAFAMLANRQQKVTLYDSGGVELAVGGGTQYTQGDTDASITGTAMLMEGAAETLLPVQGTVADGLLVNLGGNNDVTVTGSVDLGATDNAVLDDIAAKLADIRTALQIIDNIVSGNEAQVDVLTMPTVTIQDGGNTITVDGAVTINNDVDAPVFIRETADTFTTGQTTCDTTADQIVAANANRVRLILTMVGSVDVYLGASGVTTSTGLLFKGTPGNQIVIRNNDAIYGITASSSCVVSYMEEVT